MNSETINKEKARPHLGGRASFFVSECLNSYKSSTHSIFEQSYAQPGQRLSYCAAGKTSPHQKHSVYWHPSCFALRLIPCKCG